MSRRRRTLHRPLRSRLARFEHLEDRHLLSAANQAITTSAGVQQSPSVAIDPLDSNHVVVAYMDYALKSNGYAGIGVAVSHDGGGTWQYSSVPLPAGFDQGAANPTVKFDTVDHDANLAGVQNRVYVSYMAASFLGPDKPAITNPDPAGERELGFAANNGIFVSSSDDGGVGWNSAVAVTSHQHGGTQAVPFEIMPSLAVDTSATSALDGVLYISWTRMYPAGRFPGDPTATGGSDVMVAVSTDGGQFWTTRTRNLPGVGQATVLEDPLNFGAGVPAGNGVDQYSHATVGPEGDVYVSEFAGGEFTVNHALAGATTFLVPTLQDNSGLPFGVGHESLNFGLSDNQFRTLPERAIAADPSRPGTVYAAEPVDVLDPSGKLLDHADIRFSRSDDYGLTWSRTIITINDDNGGAKATGNQDDVTADQIMVQLSVGTDGTIGLTWLDTRRDPANHLLDVFGTVSKDGGATFSPNFRVTNQSFDASAGQLLIGNNESYLGDSIGLAMADGSMYAAWTDTRQGNQDIYFSRVGLSPVPAPPNDQFEPNDGRATATQLGPVAAPRELPKLTLMAGDEDWFQLQALASAPLTIVVNSSLPTGVKLELYDLSGTHLLATGELAGGVDQITYDAAPGEMYLARVLPDTAGGFTAASVQYSLSVANLTQDLGTVVHAVIAGASLQPGDQTYYLLSSTATGSIDAAVTTAPGFQGQATIEFVDPQSLAVLASAIGTSPHLKMPVGAARSLLVHVTAGAGQGNFSLDLTNLDQFSDPDLDILHFSAGADPSQEAVADFNHDGNLDVAIANAGSNTVSILLGNHDGTFDAPQQFAVGAFHLPNPASGLFDLDTYRRDILTADFNQDGIPDLAVTNYDSSDVSILLGNGNGTFKPQRRFDATAAPYGMTVGDVNEDGHQDLIVADAYAAGFTHLAVLLGRGDGTFAPETLQDSPHYLAIPTLTLADLDGNGTLDLIAAGGSKSGIDIYSGDGHGAFTFTAHYPGTRQASDQIVADVDGDGHLDLLATSLSAENTIYFLRGHGDASFGPPQQFPAGQSPIALKLVDWGSQVRLPDGTTGLGPPDGIPDLVVADSGVVTAVLHAPGAPGIFVLPGLGKDGGGNFLGYGAPIEIASAVQPLDLEVHDFNHDGAQDIGVVDHDEFFVIYGKPPAIPANDTRATARDLGTVVHLVQPTLTITPAQEDAWYRLQVPTEAFAGAGDQVLDFSGGFAQLADAGLSMAIVDAAGNIGSSGARVRLAAHQGAKLFVHIFGASAGGGVRGAGAYTLAIDTLPQVAAVEAAALLPGHGNSSGGPTTSLTLVMQGDRLDAATAEVASNYTVTWLGPNGVKGGGDDQVIAVGAGLSAGARSVVYDPSSNVDVSSGLTYPTAVRQTVTLLFGQPLPAGNYEIKVSANVVAESFNADEIQLLSSVDGIVGHPVVSDATHAGADLTIQNLVQQVGSLGSLNVFELGTRFLTQFHNDLGALLDSLLTATGDQSTTTQQIVNQILDRFGAALGPAGQRLVSMEVLFLDPVSFGLVDPEGRTLNYNLQDQSQVPNSLPQAFVEVGGNVEVVVIPNPVGHYELSVADVQARARGAAVFLGNQSTDIRSLTEALRLSGSQSFSFDFEADSPKPVPPPINQVTPESLPTAFITSQFAALGITSTSANLFSTLFINSFSTLATSAIDGPNGSGSVLRMRGDAAQALLDELFGTWDKLDHSVLGSVPNEQADTVDAIPDLFPSLRVWQIMEHLLDEIVAPKAATTSARARSAKEHHVAKQAADQAPPQQGDGKSTQSSSGSDSDSAAVDTENTIRSDSSPTDAGIDTTTAQPFGPPQGHSTSTTSNSKGTSADANSTGDNDSNATAA